MMNRIRKAKMIRQIQAELTIKEATYDQLSKEIVELNSYSPEWSVAVEKYNDCAYKIGFLTKQIEVLEKTGKTLGKAQDENHKIYGKHFFDQGTDS